jgi:AcrR family transcriptional regulator
MSGSSVSFRYAEAQRSALNPSATIAFATVTAAESKQSYKLSQAETARYKSPMSPQRSNRSALLEGALRCLERLPPERVTARAIAAEAGANIASITYHFHSKDKLVTEAAVLGLDRWLAEIDRGLADQPAQSPAVRFRRAAEAFESSRQRHSGLARNFIGAVAKAQHDPRLRRTLAAGFRRSRPNVARVLRLGGDDVATDAAALVLAMFHGLLMQVLLDPALALGGDRMKKAQARLRTVLPDRRD